MAANRRVLSAAGALCVLAVSASLVALACVGRGGLGRWTELESTSRAGPAVTSDAQAEQIIAAANAAWSARGANGGQALKAADRVDVSRAEVEGLFDSDLFAQLAEGCCKALYFAPGADAALPTDVDVNGPQAQRVRAFVGRGNSIVFNDGKAPALAFINRVFSAEIRQVPTTSGFKLRESLLVPGDHSSPSAVPEALSENLPDKLPFDASVTSAATATLPPATAVVYNNFPHAPTASPAFLVPYCQVENPFAPGGQRLSVSPVDCPAQLAATGAPCECGRVAFLGFDWLDAGSNVWDGSTVSAVALASYLSGGGAPPPAHPSAWVGGGGGNGWAAPLAAGGAGVGGAPRTVVDRASQGAPTWGMDPAGRDVIPEWEQQDAAKFAFWARDGAWRDMCGANRHPTWDPLAKRFFYNDAPRPDAADIPRRSTLYKRHWCGCWPAGFVEVETQHGRDTMGCAEMPDARRFMTPASPRAKAGAGARYYYTGPGYEYQRLLDKRDDSRYDERYPLLIRGYGADGGGGVWMDENDAGPPPAIDDFHRLNAFAPRNQWEIAADDPRPFVPALDNASPPAPRAWSPQGVMDPEYGTGRDREAGSDQHPGGDLRRATAPPQDFELRPRRRPGYVDSPFEGYDSQEDW